MYQPSETLNEIVTTGMDSVCVVEFYADTAVPPFDAGDALLRYTNVSGLSVFGEDYHQRVLQFSRAKRSGDREKNSFSVTLDNLGREPADFELSGSGFEGKIMVVRLVSRALTADAEDSLIFWAGRCLKPREGTRESLTIEAEQVFGSLTSEIPRRKYAPTDERGRAPSDKNFEGFIYLPQSGILTYKRRKSLFWGLFKKWKTERLQWSSFSDIDTDRDLPECFGRVQILGTHLYYVDEGSLIKAITAVCEGKIKEYLRIYSADYRFQQYGTLHKRLGYPPDQGPSPNDQIPIPEAGWGAANGYLANTAWIGTYWSGTAAAETDPAPDVVFLLLAKLCEILDSGDEFTVEDWTDNGAAMVRHLLLDSHYGKLAEDWLNGASFVEAYKYNAEYLFDTSFSDLIFAPVGTLAENVEGSQLLLPTGSVTSEYFKYLNGDETAPVTFQKFVTPVEYDDNIIPIEPPEPVPTPGETPSINLNVFLRRRYTTNAVANKRQKLWDFLNDCLLPNSRMFLTQGFDGKIHLKHKKPADYAIGTAAIAAEATSISADDISFWVNSLRGSVLIQPHSSISEVRSVTDANYSTAQNSVTLTASANITVTGFSGCDGASVPADALLTVDSVLTGSGTPNTVTLDGEEIAVIANSYDTVATLAGFFYASINAHPRLRRKFRADWTPGSDEVTITAKFGSLVLSSALESAHPAPLANPTTAPGLTATASGTLAAGDYRVAYAYENANGRTLISSVQTVTLAANQKITVSAITPPAGADSVIWYVSPEKNSSKLRYHSTNSGAGFVIDSLPGLNAGLPNDFNRTGTEVLRVEYVFTDRALTRANASQANNLKDSYKWQAGRDREGKNLVKISFRDSTQDFRLVELTVRDEAHIEKIGKENKLEMDGASVDNFHQAYRLASGALAENLDAAFFYQNESDRAALFLEEADVVCLTDAGLGVVNFPVIIEDIEYDDLAKGLPKAQFRMRKYSSTLYDDSVVEREIPVFQSLADEQAAVSGDLEFVSDTTGIILVDRTTGIPYRLYVDGGVLELEPADAEAPSVPNSFRKDFENIPTSSTVSLLWTASIDNFNVEEYEIQYATNSIFTTGVGSQTFPATVPFDEEESATVTGLSASTLYYFRIRARDYSGNDSDWTTNEVSADTTA